MNKLLVGVAAAALAVVPLAGCTSGPKQPVPCGNIQPPPGLHISADDIKATNTDCLQARALAGVTVLNPPNPAGFSYGGYACVGTFTPRNQEPGLRFDCTSGPNGPRQRVVSWTNHLLIPVLPT